jgi:hypothetical protein
MRRPAQRSPQRLDRQCGRVLLPRGQTAEGGYYFLPLQLQSVVNSHSFQHLRECGTAGKCRRTAIGKELRGLDPAIANAQTQAHAITADRVCLFGDRVCVSEFAGVARMRKVIFEGF